MIKALIFDWGDTIMRDFPGLPGPMAEWEKVEWVPGAQQALDVLAGRYICAIATAAAASDTDMMRKALRRIDAEKYFRFFFSSKDLGLEKKDKEFFLRIANSMGIVTGQCVHIGNHYEKDIVTARQAGMFTAFFNENSLKGSFPNADVVIEKMNDLPNAMELLAK